MQPAYKKRTTAGVELKQESLRQIACFAICDFLRELKRQLDYSQPKVQVKVPAIVVVAVPIAQVILALGNLLTNTVSEHIMCGFLLPVRANLNRNRVRGYFRVAAQQGGLGYCDSF